MNPFFFILSFSRSGSTLLAKLLNNHGDIKVLNESWVFPAVSILGWETLNYNQQRYILHIYNKSLNVYENYSPITHEVCQRARIPFLSFYKNLLSHNVALYGEKNPVNILHFPYLKRNFKDAKFIFLTRNPIAIANSYRNRWFKNMNQKDYLYRVASVIRNYYFSYKKYFNNNKMFTVRYEDLVRNPKDTLNQLCIHLEINYDASMLDNVDEFIFNTGTLKNHKDLSKDIHIDNIDKYKDQLSDMQIKDLSYLLRDVIDSFGYSRLSHKPSQLLLNIERRVSKRLQYNQSFVNLYLMKIKYYLFYLKYTISR